jgi:hypothetical protein
MKLRSCLRTITFERAGFWCIPLLSGREPFSSPPFFTSRRHSCGMAVFGVPNRVLESASITPATPPEYPRRGAFGNRTKGEGIMELESKFLDPTGKVFRFTPLFLPKPLVKLTLFRIEKIKARARGN